MRIWGFEGLGFWDSTMRDLYCLGWRIVQYRGAWGVRSMVAQGFDFILGFGDEEATGIQVPCYRLYILSRL